MKSIKKKVQIIYILLLIILPMILSTTVYSQWISRSLLSSQIGYEGRINSGKTSGCNYPAMWSYGVNPWANVTAGEWYGVAPIFSPTAKEAQVGFHNSHGEGIWILSPRIGNKTNVVTWTGPGTQRDGDNIRIFYDPRDNSEKDLGYTVEQMTGLTGEEWGNTAPSFYPYLGNWINDPQYFEKYWVPIVGDSLQQINKAENIHISQHRFGSYSEQVDGKFWPEEMVISRWINKVTGIEVTEKVYGYSYPDFDDFNIFELTFTNIGDTTGDGVTDIERTIDEIYFSLMDALKIGSMGDNWRGYEFQYQELPSLDDWYKYSDVPGDVDAILGGYKVSYQYDGDDESTKFWPDRGEPYIRDKAAEGMNIGQNEGMLQAPQYIGLVPIAYTNNSGLFTFNADDAGQYVEPTGEQPIGVNWWEIRGETDSDVPDYDQKPESELYEMVYTNTKGVFKANPADVGLNWHSQLYGPYRLEYGQSAKLVFALVGGTAAQIEGESDIVKWCEEGKIAELDKGKLALKQNIEAAHFAYSNNYNVPKAPPDVRLYISSRPESNPPDVDYEGKNTLWWTSADDATNPDYNEKDVIGYRVYRSVFNGDGGYTLIADIPTKPSLSDTGSVIYGYAPGAGPNGEDYFLVDNDSKEGFNYHYSVRSYSAAHNANIWSNLPQHIADHIANGLESGYAGPMQKTYGIQRPTSNVTTFEPYVIPNPYIENDPDHQMGDRQEVDFRRLPPKCNIYIFNSSGDLVGYIVHDDFQSSTEPFNFETWNNITDVVSGIYYWVVESKTEGSMGEIRRGTMAIVR